MHVHVQCMACTCTCKLVHGIGESLIVYMYMYMCYYTEQAIISRDTKYISCLPYTVDIRQHYCKHCSTLYYFFSIQDTGNVPKLIMGNMAIHKSDRDRECM